MYYVFDGEPLSVGIDETSPGRLTFGYVTLAEIEAAGSHFSLPGSFTMRLNNTAPYHNEVYALDNCVWAIFNNSRDYFAVFVRRNLLLLVSIVDNSHTLRDVSVSLAGMADPSLGELCCEVVDKLICCDEDMLRRFQSLIDSLESQLLSSREPNDFNMKLFEQKRALLCVYNYYDHLLDFVSGAGDDTFGALDDSDKVRFGILADRIARQKDIVRLLRDSVVQLRDAYQSNLDLRLNQIMKIFTVFTVLFSPLCFICGWYGMNFKYMPELSSRFGYVGVIVASVGVVVSLLIWFRHKRWI